MVTQVDVVVCRLTDLSCFRSLDLSEGAFQALGDMSAGVLPISWNYN